jgi:hypothetical protein
MDLTQQTQISNSSSLINDIHMILDLPDELDIITCERKFESAIKIIKNVNELVKKNSNLGL